MLLSYFSEHILLLTFIMALFAAEMVIDSLSAPASPKASSDPCAPTGATSVRRCNIYVGCLPKWTDNSWLLKEFRVFGPIVSSQVMKKGGKDNSYAFVQFTEPEMAANAVAATDGRALGDTVLSAKFADRDKSAVHPPIASLQVSNLPSACTRANVEFWFGKFGPLASVLMEPVPQHPQGNKTALVQFCGVADASCAMIAMHGVCLQGNQPLEVRYAESKTPKQKRRRTKKAAMDKTALHEDPPVAPSQFPGVEQVPAQRLTAAAVLTTTAVPPPAPEPTPQVRTPQPARATHGMWRVKFVMSLIFPVHCFGVCHTCRRATRKKALPKGSRGRRGIRKAVHHLRRGGTLPPLQCAIEH